MARVSFTRDEGEVGSCAHHTEREFAVGVHDACADELGEALRAVERELPAVSVDRGLAAEPVAERDS